MSFIKIIPLLCFALMIDGMQFFISMALSVIAAFPGTAGGCAVGGAIAGKVGCFILGALGTLPIINGVLATVTEPIGIILGFVISVCISFTFGSMLVLFLQMLGMLDKKAALMSYLGETLPGFGLLPAWTALVVYSAYKHIKQEALKKVVGGMAKISTSFVLPNTPVGRGMQQGTAFGQARFARIAESEEPEENFDETEQKPDRVSLALKNPGLSGDIRKPLAANDNAPRAANDTLIDTRAYAA